MWLLEASVRQAMEQASKAGFVPSAEQQANFAARYDDEERAGGGARLLAVAGDQAEITIKGVLTPSPSFMAMLFGGGNATYPEIVAAIREAEQDDSVRSITLAVDSPGGHVNGLFDLIAVLQGASKPITAVVHGMAASAAYAIVCQAGRIEAKNRGVRVGSIGIAAAFRVSEDDVVLSSTAAPKKRPDVRTEEGRAIVIEELDALHEIFAESIASGRGVTVEKVNADFGQGATLLAGEALKRGMIDAIAETPLKVVDNTDSTTARSGGNIPETGRMDLKTLKAQHPDVYAAAVQEGADQERDRVTAHLTFGQQCGAMETAVKAINDGVGITASLTATYLTAGKNRDDVTARQEDDAAAAAADQANASDSGADDADNVASLVEARLGVTAEA